LNTAVAGHRRPFRITYQPPIAWDALLSFIDARAARGVEVATGGKYARTVRVGKNAGVVRASIAETPENPSIHIEISDSLVAAGDVVVIRLAQLFDCGADPEAIDSHLASNGLRANVEGAPGLRVPGAFDGFEVAVRAVLGQQVTVKGASTLMARLTEAFGEPISTDNPRLTHLTPTAERLAEASVSEIREIGLPNARAASLHTLATGVANGNVLLETNVEVGHDVDSLRSSLLSLPGFGPWTADYIAMRVAHWPDAFPASDVALRHALGDVSPAEITRIAAQWSPWRAYAAMRLWLFGR
jgi:AraC family transcriptional regulator of adaptative response / DNA-3-methyladenine glycosylase II